MDNNISVEERIELIKSVGEEVIGLNELPELLESGEELICYDGMEPSGQLHIAQGIFRAINTNKMIKAGFLFKFYVADWFAFLNNKMGGDMEKIQTAGKYFVEIWKACGMDLDGVEFVWASDLVHSEGYWEMVMKVANAATLNRVLKTTQIMGRSEKDTLQASQILYPCMQTTDIYKLGARVTQLGMDQRKVNMLARDLANELGLWKPIVVSNHMIMGLGKPAEGIEDPVERAVAMKMSKSIPDSAIFMTDSREDIERKIRKAYCLEGSVLDNPILEYCKYLIFEAHCLKGQENLLKNGFIVQRPEKWGGNITFNSYEELEAAFAEKSLSAVDLKNAVVEYIDALIKPVREHFETNAEAKALLEEVQSFQITR